ncbi:asparagine synthase (glutamine-hydrolyzing) [Candidatus Riflebacteria bacterium]
MCGIHGIVSPFSHAEEIVAQLQEMGRIQKHRGPDCSDEKVFQTEKGSVGFGFVRLAILDLETGMQPLICPLDNTAIVCNGQIYNYLELKEHLQNECFQSKGDIEVALHLYRKYRYGFLELLNGMYAGAIYDHHRRKLLLFRDRFGIKPLYYTQWMGNFVFSSEIKPLLFGSNLPKKLNRSRLTTFFTLRYLPGEETMFHGVNRLPPGCYLEYDLVKHDYKVSRYWEYRLDREKPDIDLAEAREKFIELFRDAVRIRLRSDVEVGCLLGGGMDSAAVMGHAARLKQDLNLFTIAFKEKNYNELPQVQQFLNSDSERFSATSHHIKICDRTSLNRLPRIIRSLEEPVSLGTIIPTDLLCELAGEKLKVVLTGEGADEIFGGYRRFQIEMAAANYRNYKKKERDELHRRYPELQAYLKVRSLEPTLRYLQSEALFTPAELEHLLGNSLEPPSFPEDAIPSNIKDVNSLNSILAYESKARLPDYVILRLDKLSMHHSLETRTPFLDYRLAEFAATLPEYFKIDMATGREKFICSQAFFDYSILNYQTAFQKKKPFTVPLSNWLMKDNELPEPILEIVRGNLLRQQGFVDCKYFKKILHDINPIGVEPHTIVSMADKVFAIIVFSLWYQEFFM